MSRIIGSIYEITEQIGAGGGGVVYLGRHIRLNKPVVIKADKRKLTANPEVLRREVDAMKNLSHTYIPQVYDYLEEEGTAYTVMDFVEGESLDKPLKRGERFPQARVIGWARQLLEALVYLHSRPPHGILHGDIKPANIMLTPQDDIRLIDFNIALALGEEGAVRVGFSRGYASPEHYGMEGSGSPGGEVTEILDTELLARTPRSAIKTVLLEENDSQVGSQHSINSSRNGSITGKRTVQLDARSDIYCLGATLYHLFSGRKPVGLASQVAPLSRDDGVSQTVAEIIQKAMSANPADRFQSAAEMLHAFETLYSSDPRVIKQRKAFRITAATLAAVFLLGGGSTFSGLKMLESAQAQARLEAEQAEEEALAAKEEERLAKEREREAKEKEAAEKEKEREAKEAEALAKQTLELITASQQAYRDGDMTAARDNAIQALSLGTPYISQAQKVLTDALGVYHLADSYQPYTAVELPGNPIKAEISPSGEYFAVLTSGLVTVYQTETGNQIVQLEADPSALSDIIFADDNTLFYAGAGAVKACNIKDGKELWAGKPATSLALSADGKTLAGVYRDETNATVYDASTGTVRATVDFGGKRQKVLENDTFSDTEDNLFTISGDGRWLAVSFADGGLYVYDLSTGSNAELYGTIYENSTLTKFQGGFSGSQFIYSAMDGQAGVFEAYDMENGAPLSNGTTPKAIRIFTDESGIYMATGNELFLYDPVNVTRMDLAYPDSDIVDFAIGNHYILTAASSGVCAVFDEKTELADSYVLEDGQGFVGLSESYAIIGSVNQPSLRVLKRVAHDEQRLCTYDIDYDHSEARISDDGSTAMLFNYTGFRLYSMAGEQLAEVSIPDSDQVYDQQYRRDENGSYLEVIYFNGLTRKYSAKDGSLLEETQGKAVEDRNLEIFETEKYRVESRFHEAPEVYDKNSGELIGTLEENDSLTYVTQVGDYLMTEYLITGQQKRYGLLLDENLETIAELPGLCDVFADGTLVFDDRRGSLLKSHIYSLDELMELAGAAE